MYDRQTSWSGTPTQWLEPAPGNRNQKYYSSLIKSQFDGSLVMTLIDAKKAGLLDKINYNMVQNAIYLLTPANSTAVSARLPQLIGYDPNNSQVAT